MEEIGYRTSKFDFVALGEPAPASSCNGCSRPASKTASNPDSIIAPDAQDFLVDRLSTPLQFAEHLNRAFTDAFHLWGGER